VEVRGAPSAWRWCRRTRACSTRRPTRACRSATCRRQFFANVHLDALDKFASTSCARAHYVRYVDDFILLHESRAVAERGARRIREFLPARLGAHLNDSKTILQPVDRGIDFVGHVIKPWRRTTRRARIARLRTMPAEEVFESGNSTLGLVRQASHSHGEQIEVCRALMARGYTVAGNWEKVLRGAPR
jgi:RNA-directed DNA polymerase